MSAERNSTPPASAPDEQGRHQGSGLNAQAMRSDVRWQVETLCGEPIALGNTGRACRDRIRPDHSTDAARHPLNLELAQGRR